MYPDFTEEEIQYLCEVYGARPWKDGGRIFEFGEWSFTTHKPSHAREPYSLTAPNGSTLYTYLEFSQWLKNARDGDPPVLPLIPFAEGYKHYNRWGEDGDVKESYTNLPASILEQLDVQQWSGGHYRAYHRWFKENPKRG